MHEAIADDGTIGVVKLVPKDPGADRELLFEELSGVPNIVPIIDIGELADSWVLVMPRADRSLRGHLDNEGGVLPLDSTVAILIDIARALAYLDGRVVHRDLKPENVLLLTAVGAWPTSGSLGTPRRQPRRIPGSSPCRRRTLLPNVGGSRRQGVPRTSTPWE